MVRRLIGIYTLAVLLISAPVTAMAQMETLSVTVSYRERIALPPGAELDVRILDVADAQALRGAIAANRFAMVGPPMTVSLTYDPQVIDDGPRYSVFAAIRAPDGRHLFHATKLLTALDAPGPATVDIVLKMVNDAGLETAVPRRISGVPWTVTEVFGEPWENDDPATLVLDDDMNVSIYGGCNRYAGQLLPSGDGIAFPDSFAATLMACPDEVEARERRFLAALGQVTGYVRYGAGLVMKDAEERAVLHFIATPD